MVRLENKIISVVGPEGVGKSTVTKRLAEASGLPRVYPGDILRWYAKEDHTEIGEAARKMFQENAYFPPLMLLEVMRRRFQEGDLSRGFILDGAFRTEIETKGYPELLRASKLVMPVTVVALRIPGWMSVDRLVTGQNARKRTDDTSTGVIRRLGHYYDSLGLRMKAMRENGWGIMHIRALQGPDEVYNNVLQALQSKR